MSPGANPNEATPAQWTFRAQLISQSIQLYQLYPPLEMNGRFIAFSPENPPILVTRLGSVDFALGNSYHGLTRRQPIRDTWTPNIPESPELSYCSPFSSAPLAPASHLKDSSQSDLQCLHATHLLPLPLASPPPPYPASPSPSSTKHAASTSGCHCDCHSSLPVITGCMHAID
ncbi:hypothetical protein GYMLUDRAFT_1022235 [Collybiopsis luxurians FD-317 M1]|uniref:Uncharacterized protein n=1 Tax=Collybiopsis luxurians FD-317 M1 TaxID=944289 RepID=A0A0D0CI42_9AGAR|nr:hypothetical protein GYMLUDRAFT_1022235 [Collybiopsis luxurians FD-317 M1]